MISDVWDPGPAFTAPEVGWECYIKGCLLRQQHALCARGMQEERKGRLFPEVKEADIGVWVRCDRGRTFPATGKRPPRGQEAGGFWVARIH